MSRFEWNEAKCRANKKKHRVTFELATFVFQDPNIVSVLDERFDYDEERWISIGSVAPQAVLVVAHTVTEDDDGEESIRIISARRATKAEEEVYFRNLP